MAKEEEEEEEEGICGWLVGWLNGDGDGDGDGDGIRGTSIYLSRQLGAYAYAS